MARITTAAAENDEDTGYLGWAPSLLKPWAFLVILCFYILLQSMIVSGLVPAVVSTLERRYELESVQSGLLFGIYDLGVLALVIPLSFYGSQSHKPRILGVGMLFIAIGSLFFALPQYLGDSYVPSNGKTGLCGDGSSIKCELGGTPLFGVFLFGMLLIGVGATPLYTLGPAFLDEVVSKEKVAGYLAVFYAVGAVGPALGFIGGGSTLSEYVDTGAIPEGLNPLNPHWVGRWWLCFVVIFVIGTVFGIPYFFYPQYLPGTAHIRESKSNDHEVEGDHSLVVRQPGMLEATKILCFNKPFMYNIMGQAAETFVVSAAAAFVAKAVEAQYGMSAAKASILTGAIVVPGAAGGMLLGGILIHKMQPSAKKVARICAIVAVLAWLMMPLFLIGCDAPDIAGVNALYPSSASIPTPKPSKSSSQPVQYNRDLTCNQQCSCSDVFDPVCGGKTTYFNPCYAGCAIESEVGSYSSCGCVSFFSNSTVITAMQGVCPESVRCRPGVLPAFLTCLFFMMFFTFFNNTPAQVAILRVVPLQLRATGLALSSVAYRLFGAIPGPIIFGYMLDSTCAFRPESCGSESACSVYTTARMRFMFAVMGLVGKGISALCFTLSWKAFKETKQRTTDISEVSLL